MDRVDAPELDIVNTARMGVIDLSQTHTMPLLAYRCGLVTGSHYSKRLDLGGDGDDIVLIFPRIVQPTMLLDMPRRMTVDDASDADRSAVARKVFEFLAWYIGVSESCGVEHNDMHAGNVVWDAHHQALTLIDLGSMSVGSCGDREAQAELEAACRVTRRSLDMDTIHATATNLGRAGLYTPPRERGPWVGDVMRFLTDVLFKGYKDRIGTLMRLPGATIAENTTRTRPYRSRFLATLKHHQSPDALVESVLEETRLLRECALAPEMAAMVTWGLAIVNLACMRMRRLLHLNRTSTRIMGAKVAAKRLLMSKDALHAITRAFDPRRPDRYDLTDDDIYFMCWGRVHKHFQDEDINAIERLRDELAGKQIGGGSSDGGEEAQALFPGSLEDAYSDTWRQGAAPVFTESDIVDVTPEIAWIMQEREHGLHGFGGFDKAGRDPMMVVTTGGRSWTSVRWNFGLLGLAASLVAACSFLSV